MVLVVRLVEELLAAARDRLLAVRAVVTEELDVVRLAVGEAVVLEELGLGEGLVADVAREVVGVPDLAERRDRAPLAGLAATGALLEQQDLVVGRAVVVALELVAVATLELDTALLTAEVAGVHELALDEEVGACEGE